MNIRGVACRIVLTGLIASGAAVSVSPALADGNGAFRLNGFGTLGLARSNTDAAEYVRDLSQPLGLTRNWSGKVDSVLGLQGSLKLGTQTEGVVQVVSRYRASNNWDPEVSLAFLRHDFTPDWQVRAGRLGLEFYMFADSRLVGYSNTAIRPAPDFYGPLVFTYLDGVDVTASRSFGSGLLRAKLYAGRSPETTAFYHPITWDISGTRLLGGHLDLVVDPWQFRITHAEARFSGNQLPLNALASVSIASNPALAPLAPLLPIDLTRLIPELGTVGTTSSFDSIGVVYDRGPLQVQGMLGRIAHESEAYQDSRAGFVLASYRIGQFKPYAGYSKAKSSLNRVTTIPAAPPGVGVALNQLGQALSTATRIDQHTVTLGARWDFREHWALKAQLDLIRGSRDSVFLFRGSDVQWNGRMNVVSAALDFAF